MTKGGGGRRCCDGGLWRSNPPTIDCLLLLTPAAVCDPNTRWMAQSGRA